MPVTRARRLPALAVAAAAVGACAVLAGCGTSSAAGSDGVRTWAAGKRPAAPHLQGTTLAGTPYDSAHWAGRVVVVNFWASWCPPCQDEAQTLQQVYADSRSVGVTFLGVDVRDNEAQARTFVRAHHVTYPSLFDPSSESLLAFREPVLPTSPPTTLVIDRHGRVAAMIVGEARYSVLKPLVQQVAAEQVAAHS